MPNTPIDYAAPPSTEDDRLTPPQVVGRCVAAASILLPFVAMTIDIGTAAVTGTGPPARVRLARDLALGAGCVAGLVGLGGVRLWGGRGVWLPATLGIAYSVFWYLEGQIGFR